MNYLIPRKGGGEGVGAVATQHIAAINACLHLDNFSYCYVSQKSWGIGNPQNYNKGNYVQDWENFFNFFKLSQETNISFNKELIIKYVDCLDLSNNNPALYSDNTVYFLNSLRVDNKITLFNVLNSDKWIQTKKLLKSVLQKRINLLDPNYTNVTMHIRRGEVVQSRYIPMDFYIQKYQELLTKHNNLKFYIFTEKEDLNNQRFEHDKNEFDFFKAKKDVEILRIDPFDAIYNMINSDIFIPSNSASSDIIKLYTDAVVYS